MGTATPQAVTCLKCTVVNEREHVEVHPPCVSGFKGASSRTLQQARAPLSLYVSRQVQAAGRCIVVCGLVGRSALTAARVAFHYNARQLGPLGTVILEPFCDECSLESQEDQRDDVPGDGDVNGVVLAGANDEH